MGILLQNLSQFEANDYSESSPYILSEVRVRLDHYFDRQADTELIVLTDDKSPTRLLAGMILPTRKAYFPVADWPVAESWEEAATVLAFYAKHVAAQSPGRPSLVLKASGGESPLSKSCGPFEWLTTILCYRFCFPDDQRQSCHEINSSQSLSMVDVAIDEAATLLEVISRDSQDCPELQSMMSWKARLTDYRDSEESDFLGLRQLIVDGEPIGVVVWRESKSTNEVELKYLGITPEKRHLGWGTQFLKQMLSELEDRGYDSLFLQVDFRNVVAVELYEKCGFEQWGRQELWMATVDE